MNLKRIIQKELNETYEIYNFDRPLYENFNLSCIHCKYLSIETNDFGYPWEDTNVNDNLKLNNKYIENVLKLSIEIFDKLNFSESSVIVFDFPMQEGINKIIENIEKKTHLEIHNETYKYKDNRKEYIRVLYSLSQIKFNPKDLFKEIILADLGGIKELASSVFIFDTNIHLMYHLYDDRGIDIFSNDVKKLLPIYKKYKDYVLEHNLR